MNERIKQLAEQAGFDLIQHGDHVIYDISTKENMSEFARLIVQECFQVVDDYGVKQSGEPETQIGLNLLIGMKITDAAWKIKQHFGIE